MTNCTDEDNNSLEVVKGKHCRNRRSFGHDNTKPIDRGLYIYI